MTTDRTCNECGKTIPETAPQGLCPDCVMRMALGTGVDIGPETEDSGQHSSGRFVPPSPEELAPHFPQLEISSLLGRGGMGAVYKARQTRLDRFVALKILPPGLQSDPDFAKRFVREAQALAKLHHPHIVTLFEFGEANGLYFFLMEFVDGVNLRQLLSNGRISAQEALAIVPQFCEALQYAHDRGIVHRDIKPENILLNQQGHVKIADFGVARIMGLVAEGAGSGEEESGVASGAGRIVGTPQYMAPEQATKPNSADHRADIYSLGVVFYQMLTGEMPTYELRQSTRKISIDVRLDEIVMRALDENPALRFQNVSEFKTQVESVTRATQNPGPEDDHISGGNQTSAPSQSQYSQLRLHLPACGILYVGITNFSKSHDILPSEMFASPQELLLNIMSAQALIVTLGAVRILRTRSYSFAVLTALLTMCLPHLGWLFGLWTLIALRHREICHAFSEKSVLYVRDSEIQKKRIQKHQALLRAPWQAWTVATIMMLWAGISLLTIYDMPSETSVEQSEFWGLVIGVYLKILIAAGLLLRSRLLYFAALAIVGRQLFSALPSVWASAQAGREIEYTGVLVHVGINAFMLLLLASMFVRYIHPNSEEKERVRRSVRRRSLAQILVFQPHEHPVPFIVLAVICLLLGTMPIWALLLPEETEDRIYKTLVGSPSNVPRVTIPKYRSGPVRILDLSLTGDARYLDIDEGQTYPGVAETEQNLNRVLDMKGVDISIARYITGGSYAIGHNLATLRLDDEQWDTMEPAEIINTIASVQTETSSVLQTDTAYAFRTKQRGMGLLRLAGSTSHSVTVQYKLVRPSNAAGAEPAVTMRKLPGSGPDVEDLEGRIVTQADLERIATKSELVRLDLSFTNVTDSDLKYLAGLSKLEWLGLAQSRRNPKGGITDRGLVHLSGLTNLRYLQLSGNGVTDTGLEHLKAKERMLQEQVCVISRI